MQQCPECGSWRVYNDGFRSAPINAISQAPIQRYRCADCRYRFSEHMILNKAKSIETNHQVCVIKKAKNLTSTQEKRACVGMADDTPTESEIKTWAKIESFLFQLTNDGRKPSTILNYRKSFKRLLKDGADLFDPESSKAALAKSTLKESTKKTVVGILGSWFDYNQIPWRPPKYSDEHDVPYIPTESELNLLIAALGEKTSCFCQVLKDTGARAGEIAELDWTSIDWEQKKVRIKGEKGSNSRIRPLSEKTLQMLARLPRINQNSRRKSKIFASADDMRTNFFLQKRRIAKRQANPKLMLIHFHTFRHFVGTMEQHKTKDIYHVKEVLGHKSVKSTETYIHLEAMIYEGTTDQFISKIAHNVEEACKLTDVGFDYVTGEYSDGGKIFRKRK